ncbi:MAG: tetratricopeptide repeat protein [Alphaproteobacteria bacterium]|nr:tetratricopeptide repeat protein [Alphaproteobacteria bacterium]
MKNFMIKSLLAVIFVSLAVLACSQDIFKFGENDNPTAVTPQFDKDGYWRTNNFIIKKNQNDTFSYYGTNSLYGAYMAARVAHLRQDFDNAAEYYKIVMDKDASNSDINRTVYVILSSLGQIGEATPYAQKEIEQGNTESIAPLIVAIKDFADGKYAQSRENINLIKDKAHTSLINPLFDAWTYAGEQKEELAIKSIDKIAKDPAIEAMKLFHKGLIYDYLGNKEKAQEMYANIIKNHYQSVTYRLLDVITDFYVRNGDKETAKKIFGRYNDNGLLSILLDSIDKRIETTHENSPAIINTPQKGLSEALFNIGTIFRSSVGGTEFAQIYIAASSYLNPEYDISKIALANVLEEIGLLKEANKYYKQVGKNSGSYFIARAKIIENLNTLKEYEEAEKQIKFLLKDYPDNTQLLSDLGTIYGNMNKHNEAVEYYQKAIKSAAADDQDIWPIYYALAVSYDQLNQKIKAEQNLQKALQLSNQNPDILNYLGYSWLEQGRNIEQAIKMILNAYKHNPYEGHIIDSMGWIYFKLGMYEKAVEFLEQAAAMNPGNAVINDHLGDAYWFAGRKNEAVFQWNHALDLNEDADNLNKQEIINKVENGALSNIVYSIHNPEIMEMLKNVTLADDK